MLQNLFYVFLNNPINNKNRPSQKKNLGWSKKGGGSRVGMTAVKDSMVFHSHSNQFYWETKFSTCCHTFVLLLIYFFKRHTIHEFAPLDRLSIVLNVKEAFQNSKLHSQLYLTNKNPFPIPKCWESSFLSNPQSWELDWLIPFQI